MKKLLLTLLFLLCGARYAGAQSTTVSGTITDAGAQTWNGGTFTFTFVPNPNFPVGPYTWTGGALPNTVTGTLSGTGTYSASVPSNSTITPGQSTWNLQVCPNATFACFNAGNATITGATQTINATPPVIAIKLSNPPTPFTTAYADSEIVAAGVGSQYYNVTSSVYRVCTAVSGTSCTTWVASGGSGTTIVSSLPATCTPGVTQNVQLSVAILVGSPAVVYGPSTVFYCDSLNHFSPVSQGSGAAPNLGFYLSPQCPPSNSAQCFNTPANTQQSNSCTFTNLSTTVTCNVPLYNASAAVVSNVATYTFPQTLPASIASGDSVTAAGFGGADTIFNITCTVSTVTASTVTCPLTHANASSTTFGTVTDTTAGPFVAADAGTGNPYGAKRIFGYGSCQAFSGIGPSNGVMVATPTTISAFNSSHSITMSQAAGSTPGGSQNCVIWGNLDDAGWAAMDVAMQSQAQCPMAHLAAAFYMVTVPHSTLNPPGCKVLPSLVQSFVAGNMFYASGFELQGRGPGATTVYMTPQFPETGACTNGLSGVACWVVQPEGRWSSLQLSGGGNGSSTNFPSGKNMVEIDGPANLDYFTGTNFGSTTAGTVGIAMYVWTQLTQVNGSGFGDATFASGATNAVVSGFRVSADRPGTYGFRIGSLTEYFFQNALQFDKYHFTCWECSAYGQSSLAAPNLMRVDNARSIKLVHGRLTPFNNTGNGMTGLNVFGGGNIIDLEDTFIDMTMAGTNTATGDIAINMHNAGTVLLKDSLVKGTTGGTAYQDVAGAALDDLGGNTIGPITSILGTLIADGHSLKGACTGVATASSTLGLYNTGPNVTATTCTSTNIGTGVSISGVRTLQNLVVTSTAAGVNASSGVVTVLKNGATTTITCTIGTGTSCSDGTHTVALADGDLISIQFTSQAADTLAGVKAIVEWN